MLGRTERPGDQQHICRLDLRNAAQHHLATVHLAHLFLEEALGIGHHEAGITNGLVDHVLLGIVDLIGDIEHPGVVVGDVLVGLDGMGLAILLRVTDADGVVDLLVETKTVVNDRLVIDEVITAKRLWFVIPLSA